MKPAATAVANEVSAASVANAVVVTAVGVAVVVAKVVRRAVSKDTLKAAQKAVPKAVLKDARRAAVKVVAVNVASVTRKAATKPVARSGRNVQPAKAAAKALRKVAARTANRAPKADVVKAAVASATAVTVASAVIVASAPPPVTRSSRTSRWPTRPRWRLPWVVIPQTHRDVARTDPPEKRVRTRAIVHKVTVRKATGSRAVIGNPVAMAAVSVAVSAVVAAMTVVKIHGKGRTQRQTRWLSP